MKNYFVRLWNALWASTDIDEKAAEALNISERTLYRKIKEYGIKD